MGVGNLEIGHVSTSAHELCKVGLDPPSKRIYKLACEEADEHGVLEMMRAQVKSVGGNGVPAIG